MNKSILSPTSALVAATFFTTGAFATLTGLTEWYSVWAMLAVAGVWLILAGLRVLPLGTLDRRILWPSLAVGIAGVAASAFSEHPVYSAVYDSFAHMPLVVWLAAVAAFVLAATLHFGTGARNGLVIVLVFAAYPAAVGLFQSVLGRPLTAFGNSNYFVSVVAMLAVIALGVGRTSPSPRGRLSWRLYALVLAVSVIAQGTLIGYLTVPAAILGILAVDPMLVHDRLDLGRAPRRAAALVAAFAVGALLLASVPAVSGSLLTAERAQALGANAEARLDLWRGAQRMFAEKPALGYGPGGYKLSSAGFAGPAAYRVAAVIEPLDVAPPSPHSLLWTALTSFGLLGIAALLALAVGWVLVLLDRQATDASARARSLRMSLALAFGAYSFVLLTVPVSAAQGLLPAAVAGLAVASPKLEPGAAKGGWERWLPAATGVIALALAAASVAAYVGYWSMVPEDVDATLGRFRLAQSLQPHDPLYRYREYEYRLMNAGTDAEAARVRSEIDAESGVIASYAPGLVGLVALSLDEGARTGRRDFSWERGTLERAEALAPYFPTLLAEKLHLAAVQGDQQALRKAIDAAKRDTSGLPLLQDYLARSESLLATGSP